MIDQWVWILQGYLSLVWLVRGINAMLLWKYQEPEPRPCFVFYLSIFSRDDIVHPHHL